MKANTGMVRSTARDYSNGQMALNTMESFWIITYTEKVKYTNQGIYKWSDARLFEGEWKNNKMDGHGLFTWPDKRKYEGAYKDDKKEGYGVFEWADGRRYKGMWKNGKQHGEGEFYNHKEGIWRKGVWSDGKRIKWDGVYSQ
jgi:hypothetical protein